MEQIQFTQKDIVDKEFKQKRMGVGYDPADVDTFLDAVIKDYGTFNTRIDQLQNEVTRLQDALKRSQEQVRDAKAELLAQQRQQVQTPVVPVQQPVPEPVAPIVEQPVQVPFSAPVEPAVTNLDLLKRVANLERAVFGKEHGE